VRDRIRAVALEFPETRGLTPAAIRRWMAAHERLVIAMMGLEGVFGRQHPDRDGDAIFFVHGSRMTSGFLGCRGRVPRSAPPLSRDEWCEWGRRVKAIRMDLMALMMELQTTATKDRVRRFDRALDAVGVARSALDGIVCGQHPDWEDATRVFYGQD
jgi:hypothetical protein